MSTEILRTFQTNMQHLDVKTQKVIQAHLANDKFQEMIQELRADRVKNDVYSVAKEKRIQLTIQTANEQ